MPPTTSSIGAFARKLDPSNLPMLRSSKDSLHKASASVALRRCKQDLCSRALVGRKLDLNYGLVPYCFIFPPFVRKTRGPQFLSIQPVGSHVSSPFQFETAPSGDSSCPPQQPPSSPASPSPRRQSPSQTRYSSHQDEAPCQT